MFSKFSIWNKKYSEQFYLNIKNGKKAGVKAVSSLKYDYHDLTVKISITLEVS